MIIKELEPIDDYTEYLTNQMAEYLNYLETQIDLKILIAQ